MKKMIISVILFLMCGTVFAQYAAPENLGVSFPISASTGLASKIYLYWDTIVDPDFDCYEYFHDGEPYEDPNGTGDGGYIIIDMLQDNDYHTTGIRAVYMDGGTSDTVSITYYYSATAYSNPTNLVIENSLDEWLANVQFDEPQSGGTGAPTPQEYIYYINGIEYVESSTCPGVTLLLDDFVGQDESYILGIEVQYSDGHSSTTFRPMVHKESYFGQLNPAENLMIDETTGTLTWNVPGNSDVIGGTISNLAGCINDWEGYVWSNSDPFRFGDGTNHVSTSWSFSDWIHNRRNTDIERMEFGTIPADVQDTYFCPIDVTDVNQISNASTLEFEDSQSQLYDADTSPDYYGDFLVHKNKETGYYGVVQVIDVTDCLFTDIDNYEFFDMTWWFQTNGSDDFSSALRYYPLYYNIYLDGALVDSVNYEIVTVDKDTYELIVVDSTLSPTGEFEYQFEGLVNGETYTAEVEAVYYACVGKAERQSIQFTYNGISVDDPQIGSTIPEISNYPNPFKQYTNISFSITKPGHVTLDVYNIKGERVRTLMDETLEAADHIVTWNGTNDRGKSVSNGVYLYRMSLDDKNVISNKMILMKYKGEF